MKNLIFTILLGLTFSIMAQKAESEFKYVYISKIPKPKFPPKLEILDLKFNDSQGNNNNALDPDEKGEIQFNLSNTGKGDAYAIRIAITDQNNTSFIKYLKFKSIPVLKAEQSELIRIPIESTSESNFGVSEFKIIVSEGNGFDADPVPFRIKTFGVRKPQLANASHKFSYKEGEGKIKLGEMVNLQLMIQNIGQGVAKDIIVTFKNPDKVYEGDKTVFKIDKLDPNENKTISYDFFANKQYKESTISINVVVSESQNKYGFVDDLIVGLEQVLEKTTTFEIPSDEPKDIPITKPSLYSDVDEDVPSNTMKNEHKYALIIGNEDYKSHQSGIGSEVNVPFAISDAKSFKTYAINLLGVPESNVSFYPNLTAAQMRTQIDRLSKLISAEDGKGELIFYYAGHGYPEEVSKTPYIIPVDVSGESIENGINLYKMYKQFTDANPKRVTVFLDACFSGGARNEPLIAARGVLRKPKEEEIHGNILIFSATSAEQTALSYKAKQHGMFTYHLLKKLKETKGDITYGDMFNFVNKAVKIESLKVNQKVQEPTYIFGDGINSENIKNVKINE